MTAGALAAGRAIEDVTFICPVFIVVGDTEEERSRQREAVRRQLAFYASTPTYAPVLEHHGFADVAPELQRLVRVGDFTGMAAVMSDDVIAPYMVTATWADLPGRLTDRYAGVADRILSYLPDGAWTTSPEQAERWRDVVRAVARTT